MRQLKQPYLRWKPGIHKRRFNKPDAFLVLYTQRHTYQQGDNYDSLLSIGFISLHCIYKSLPSLLL